MTGSGIGVPASPGIGWTFLELLERLFDETARQGVAPTTTVNQTGMNKRLVNWINTAYTEIQNLHETWRFRRGEFSFSTVSGTSNYTPASVGLNDLSAWFFIPNGDHLSGVTLYLNADDENHLNWFPWQLFRASYKYGSHRTMTGRPSAFSIKPDNSMELWATPDNVYTVTGEYLKSAVLLSGDTDRPVFKDFQEIIVWRALMFYGAFEGAQEVYDHAQNEYNDALLKLEINQLPKIGYGPSLV